MTTKKDDNIFTRQLQNLMTEKIDSIEKTPLNIAITGDSGTGKSTIINTLRGIRPSDPAAAAVGITECTTNPTPYNHPHFPNVVFWDLPGVGTPKNPQSSYKKRMNLGSYDFFIITISSRFTENAFWLAKTLNKIKKPYFFVRSKLDLEITMKKKHYPGTLDHHVIDELRSDIRKQTEQLSISPEIYVISGEIEHSDRWDFPLLKKRIIEILPDVKKNTMIVSLGSFAEDIIDTKYQVLKRRIVYYSTASAVGAVVPIPGFSFGVDITLIMKMAHEFARAFSLTSGQVKRSYQITERTKVMAILGKSASLLTSKAILGILGKQAASGIFESSVKFIPLMGQGAAATISFLTTYNCGKILLKKMRKLAQEMAQEIIDYNMEQEQIVENPQAALQQ
jgi:predicted GTPase/uncharacterized protein (DUF697 family)